MCRSVFSIRFELGVQVYVYAGGVFDVAGRSHPIATDARGALLPGMASTTGRMDMTVYFVSQHERIQRWARIMNAKGGKLPHRIDQAVENIDPEHLQPGDVVMGTLPMHVAAALESRGIAFWALDLHVPPQDRRKELSATELAKLGATLTRYRVSKDGQHAVKAERQRTADAPRPAVTVMLVSGEIMPNYLGYLHAPTPWVLLAASDQMRKRADELEKLLNDAPRRPDEIVRIPVESTDYAALDAKTRDLLDHLLEIGHDKIVLNATGGTKLMSMALTHAGQQAARNGDPVDAVYVDTAAGRIEHLTPDTRPLQPMRAVLDVRAAVLASGKPDAGCVSASSVFRKWMSRTQLHRYLLGDSDRLALFNALVAQMEELQRGKEKSEQGVWRIKHDVEQATRGHFIVLPGDDFAAKQISRELRGKLGAHLAEAGVLRTRPQTSDAGVELQFTAPSEIGYLLGSWLEAHVASLIEAAGPDDWACGVQVGSERGKNNELDAIIVSGNRTLLIEVKAANLARKSDKGGGKKSTKAQDTVYKLDSVGHTLGHYFSGNWLVTARALDDDDQKRARDKRIEVFSAQPSDEGKEPLQHFARKLKEWIDAGRGSMPRDDGYAARVLEISRDAKQKIDAKSKLYERVSSADGAGSDAAQAAPSDAPAAPASEDKMRQLEQKGLGGMASSKPSAPWSGRRRR